MTDELEPLRRALAAQLDMSGPEVFVRLTDEEIAALDYAPDEEPVAPSPYLDQMEPHQREWAVATALRSLAARGVVEVRNNEEIRQATAGPGDGPVSVELAIVPPVELVLTGRAACPAIVSVETNGLDGSDWLCLYLPGVTSYSRNMSTSVGCTVSPFAAQRTPLIVL